MRNIELYAQILEMTSPCQVSSVDLNGAKGEVTVEVAQEEGIRSCCPSCGKESLGYDSRKRSWRHLDTCQYKTILVAEMSRAWSDHNISAMG
ncbi:hypothetical protein MNBD_GAMMA12-2225 [hydrothermal vent metagenome]|uniref:Transposase IS204/IS1001/IS1096/IS1165 zinc-finger domain-containing protein n=1 Tax=hydrothermal vent metagenome TaxID=652676 RepID=A0A3B0YKP2_9ZZZZ